MKHDFLQPLAGVAASAVALANLDTLVTILAVIVGVINTGVLLARVFVRLYDIIKKHARGEITAEEADTELQKIQEGLKNANSKPIKPDNGQSRDKVDS